MNLSPKAYLLLYGAIVILILYSLLSLRKGRAKPTKLKLGREDSRSPVTAHSAKGINNFGEQTVTSKARSLNVVFQHKETWYDAYEVLRLPAGAPQATVNRQFQTMKSAASGEELEILERAYNLIQSS